MNKFTEIIYILKKEKLPNVPTKSLIVQYAFHCYLRKKICHIRFWYFQEWKKDPF